MTENKYLTVPTTPPTLIPLGLSPDDFALLEQSMKLWKPRISPPSQQKIADETDGQSAHAARTITNNE